MNAAQKEYLRIARRYKGARIGSKKHKELVDQFNRVKPDGWAMTYTAPWCATAASAWAIEAFGIKLAKKYFPLSANCGIIITLAQKKGIWRESDRIVPEPGDWLLYDWGDSGIGDNRGVPDHVGVIEDVDGRTMTVLEGNKGNPGSVGERSVKVNGRYIRGYVTIDWHTLDKEWRAASDKTPVKKKAAAEYKTGTYTVTAKNGLNYRAGAGTGYRKMGAIARGSRFKVTKTSGSWGYSPALKGWLCLDYSKRG